MPVGLSRFERWWMNVLVMGLGRWLLRFRGIWLGWLWCLRFGVLSCGVEAAGRWCWRGFRMFRFMRGAIHRLIWVYHRIYRGFPTFEGRHRLRPFLILKKLWNDFSRNKCPLRKRRCPDNPSAKDPSSPLYPHLECLWDVEVEIMSGTVLFLHLLPWHFGLILRGLQRLLAIPL